MDEPKKIGRFSAEDVVLIRSTFKDNATLLKLMRKVFLPNQVDDTLDIGEIAGTWNDIRFADLTPEMAWVTAVARQQVIQFVEFYLKQLATIANQQEESPMNRDERRAKNSAK